ncbi:MAG: UDP-4-amino-4,6-dideoxy-N-acetyl-beta-L-altrosamine transaminase [Magnetococcales bacterium]|nr:UDP-4-amino-4,6-dideoxy-N-acetyl-beta-L-altrosamine transaminase [Magnetococcales bacterium]
MSAPAIPFLPYGKQWIDEADEAAVLAALRSDYLTTGPAAAAFEEAFAARVEAKYAVCCSSGTAALHLAALALDLSPGEAIVVPALTFLATANCARFVGAEVIFADVDPRTGLMEPHHVEAALAREAHRGWKPRAIFPVHLNGHCAEVEALSAWARARDLAVVEDACHALGGRYGTEPMTPVGDCRHSAMTVFSFHPVKAIATGEGGMVTTNDPALRHRLARLRNHGMTRDAESFQHRESAFDDDGSANPWYYEMPEAGFNYRLSDIHCALGLSQLGKLDRFADRRRALASRYDRLLAPLAPMIRPVPRPPKSDGGWHLYVVQVDFPALGLTRAQVMHRLKQKGIGTQVHYLPVNRQPYYRQRYGALSLPGADAYYAQALSLPLYPSLSDDDVERVAAALVQLVERTS